MATARRAGCEQTTGNIRQMRLLRALVLALVCAVCVNGACNGAYSQRATPTKHAEVSRERSAVRRLHRTTFVRSLRGGKADDSAGDTVDEDALTVKELVQYIQALQKRAGVSSSDKLIIAYQVSTR